MNGELQKSAVDVLSQPVNALIVSGTTMTSGVSLVMQWGQAALGCVAAILGIILTCIVIKNTISKEIREKRLFRAQLDLAKKELKKGEKS